MRRILFVVFMLLFVVSAIAIAAGVDDQGNPNDPAVNERANACYEGGSMEGKCDTDWEWVCGWHLIRAEADETYVMPEWCESLLPKPPASGEANVGGGNPCVFTNFLYFKITGPLNTSPNGAFYSDAGCTSGGGEGTLVQAADLSSANAICDSILGPRGLTNGGAVLAGGALPADYWFCSYSPPA